MEFAKPTQLPRQIIPKSSNNKNNSIDEKDNIEDNENDRDENINVEEEDNLGLITFATLKVQIPEFKYDIPEWTGVNNKFQYFFEVLKEGVLVETIKFCDRKLYENMSSKIAGWLFISRLPPEISFPNILMQLHPSISRQHAVFQMNQKGEVYLFDLGSTHGTFLNKRKIKEHTYIQLRVGDVIKFGQSSKLFHFTSSIVSLEDQEMKEESEKLVKLVNKKKQEKDEKTKKEMEDKEAEEDEEKSGDGEKILNYQEMKKILKKQSKIENKKQNQQINNNIKNQPKQTKKRKKRNQFGDIDDDDDEDDLENENDEEAEENEKNQDFDETGDRIKGYDYFLGANDVEEAEDYLDKTSKVVKWKGRSTNSSSNSTSKSNPISSGNKSKERAETPQSLKLKINQINQQKEEIYIKIAEFDAKKVAIDNSGADDDIDSYLHQISAKEMDSKKKVLEKQLNELLESEKTLKKLLSIAVPALDQSLPLQLSSHLPQKNIDIKKETSEQRSEYQHSKISVSSNETINKDTPTIFETDIKPTTNVKPPPSSPSPSPSPSVQKNINNIVNKKEERANTGVIPKNTAKKQKLDADDPNEYVEWTPPKGQKGDGRTHLNDKFGY